MADDWIAHRPLDSTDRLRLRAERRWSEFGLRHGLNGHIEWRRDRGEHDEGWEVRFLLSRNETANVVYSHLTFVPYGRVGTGLTEGVREAEAGARRHFARGGE
jgi:hypothetical protein